MNLTQEQFDYFKKIDEEIQADSLKNVLGKLYNKLFVASNTKIEKDGKVIEKQIEEKDFSNDSTKDIKIAPIDDNNRAWNLTKGTLGKVPFYTLGAGGFLNAINLDLSIDSQVWNLIGKAGVSEENVESMRLLAYNLTNNLEFTTSDFDILLEQMGNSRDTAEVFVSATLVGLGFMGGWTMTRYNDMMGGRMYHEEDIASYSDDMAGQESIKDIKYKRNESIFYQQQLNNAGNKSGFMARTLLSMVEKATYLSHLPEKALNKIGKYMLKEDKNAFDKVIEFGLKASVNFDGYALSAYEKTTMFEEALKDRNEFAERTKHQSDPKEQNDSFVNDDSVSIYQNSYQVLLRRKIKKSLEKSIKSLEENKEILGKLVTELEETRQSSSSMKKILKIREIKSKMSPIEKEYKESLQVLKNIRNLHSNKSNQRNNHYEVISQLANEYLENGRDSLKEETVNDYIDRRLEEVIDKKTKDKIKKEVMQNTEEIIFKTNQSKSYFCKQLAIELYAGFNVLKNTNSVGNSLNSFRNNIERILKKSTMLPKDLVEKASDNYVDFLETISQDQGNQQIKNPIQFKKLIENEKNILVECRLEQIKVLENHGKRSNRG
jgi:hypothetical protein